MPNTSILPDLDFLKHQQISEEVFLHVVQEVRDSIQESIPDKLNTYYGIDPVGVQKECKATFDDLLAAFENAASYFREQGLFTLIKIETNDLLLYVSWSEQWEWKE
jgi:hypothetical protein